MMIPTIMALNMKVAKVCSWIFARVRFKYDCGGVVGGGRRRRRFIDIVSRAQVYNEPIK